MLVYDKTNNKIEIVDEVNISSLVERYNVSLSDLFFDRVSVCSMSELREFFEDDLIDEDIYNKAVKDFIEKISKDSNFDTLKLFTFVDTEREKEVILNTSEEAANILAAEKSNDLISFFNDYRDFELDVTVYANISELLKECCDNEIILDFFKYDVIFQKKPTQNELASYLGVTKGAVSQYPEIKKDLMVKGLLYERIAEAF